MKKITAILTIMLVSVGIAACTPSTDSQKSEITNENVKTIQSPHFFLNSVLSINILDDRNDKEKLDNEISDMVQGYEEKFTVSSDTSEVSKISKNSGVSPVKVSKDTFELIKKSIYFSQLSSGAFDITVEPLVVLWGIGTEHPKVPSEKEIKKAVSLINYDKIELDENNQTVYMKNQGMSIDLGGIAKGYVTDKIVDYLRKKGVKSAIINMGGNIYALGNKSGNPFKIGIRDGFSKNPSDYFCTCNAEDTSIVSSGIYERNFEHDGKIYHHILSTQTGYPVDNEIFGTTIICKSSTDADALSTTVFALGIIRGMDLIESLSNTEAIIITKDKKIYLSSGLKGKINITDKSYKFAE